MLLYDQCQNVLDIVHQNALETHLQPLNVIDSNLCRFILFIPLTNYHCSMHETLNQLPLKASRHHHGSN